MRRTVSVCVQYESVCKWMEEVCAHNMIMYTLVCVSRRRVCVQYLGVRAE